MAEIRTVQVVIERVVVQSVTWDIDMGEFAEWIEEGGGESVAVAITDPQNVKEFIEADRYYAEALRDKIRDLPAGSWGNAFSWPDAKIEKVVIL